jgi:type II secretory pathway component PulF
MFSNLSGWVLVAIVVGVVILIGGILLPIVVPMMVDYTDASSDTLDTGTSFLQLLAAWLPLIIPAIIVFGIIIFVMAHRSSP